MSDMALDRITIRVPAGLGQRLRRVSAMKSKSESQVVREALEQYLERASGESSAYELAQAANLIGCLRRAPKDLSINPAHFEGFGSD